MEPLTTKFMTNADNMILKSHNNDYNPMGHLEDLKEFLLHGVINTKSYNSPQINDATMILPNELLLHYFHTFQDVSILEAINIIYTDANSIVFPIRKTNKNTCIWHEYGKSPNHDNQDEFQNKLINLSTLSTCPIVSRDFLFKNEKFTQWLMEIITNDIYNEVCLSIFSSKKRSPSVENLIINLDKESKTIIKNNNENDIITHLTQIINKIPTIYRHKSKFFFSRDFFNNFLEELLEFKHPFSSVIFNRDQILGYDYQIVESMDSNAVIFGSLKDSYSLIIKNDQYLERDSITKKNFVQFFFANTLGGSIVNHNSIHMLVLEENKEE